MENRIAFKINTGHYLEILTPKTLLGSTETNVRCSVLNNDYHQYCFVQNCSKQTVCSII